MLVPGPATAQNFIGSAPGSVTCQIGQGKIKFRPALNNSRGGTNMSRISAQLVDCVTTNGVVTVHRARLRGFFDSSPIDCSTLTAADVPVSLTVSFRGRVNGTVDSISFSGRARFAKSRFSSAGEQLITDSTGQETLSIPDAGDPVAAVGSFAPGIAVATLDVQYPPNLLQLLCAPPGEIWSLPLSGAIYLGSPDNPPLGIDSLQDLGSDATAIND
ncbi:MAG TPA: hypothetical protein VK386_03970, partial [Acidimicrobiales bacterium]|nr:hypothetical protein [Acidimicrobiales bacterium]